MELRDKRGKWEDDIETKQKGAVQKWWLYTKGGEGVYCLLFAVGYIMVDNQFVLQHC